jgi:hypothetical protein
MSAVSYRAVRVPRLLPLLAIAAAVAVPLAHAKDPPAADEGEPIDVADHRDKLVLATDGKQHYLAVVPFGDMSSPTYYGDGKTFWKQRIFGGGSSGKESFSRTFWDPRGARYSQVSYKDGRYIISCDEREVELKPVPDAERDTIVAGARFFPPRWKHRAYALARDNEGKYYYVDRLREPEQNRSFRLFVGPRGNMKQQKMINVVSDSEGDIFATKSGSLRLILDKKETLWVQGKKKTPLVSLPIDKNHVLIHTDLGPYTGQRLGTPCDDL